MRRLTLTLMCVVLVLGGYIVQPSGAYAGGVENAINKLAKKFGGQLWEEEIEIAEAPIRAQNTILASAGGEDIQEVTRVSGAKGVVFFQAEWIENCVEREVWVTPRGRKLRLSYPTWDVLPKKVRRAARRRSNDNPIREIKKIVWKFSKLRAKARLFQIGWIDEDEEHELLIAENGQVLYEKVEHSDEEPYDPIVDPDEFVQTIDNPYLPSSQGLFHIQR